MSGEGAAARAGVFATLWRRVGLLFDLALLSALLLFSGAVLDWRAEGLAGYGLRREVVASGGRASQTNLDPWVAADGSETTAPPVRRWRGTLVTPRAGQHQFFLRLEDRAALSSLRIDGQTCARQPWTGRGHRFAIVLRAGSHQIELEVRGARGGTRLLWSPARPGGVPEVLPPTLLFPGTPGPSVALQAHAVGPRDATALLALAGALLLVLLLWLRRSLRRALALLRREGWARLDLLLTLILFALTLGLRLWDGAAVGPTLGEGPLAARAHNVLQLCLAGRFDALSWSWASAQPGLGAAWIAAPSALALGALGAGRELMAVVGALTCALLFLVAREGVGRGVGFLAAALAVVLPPLWAYQRLLDPAAPATLLYLLSMWFFLRGLRLGLPVNEVAEADAAAAPASRPALGVDGSGYFIAGGVAAGWAIASSPNAISLLLAQLVLYAVVALRRRSARTLALPPSLALAPLALVGVFMALHPPLWHAPLHELGLLLLALGRSPEPEFFYGTLRVAPWSYAPNYLLAALPVGIAFAAGLGVLRVLWRQEVGGLAALVWLCAALLLLHPAGGASSVLPALPVVCLLAAAGVDGISRLVVRLLRRPLWRLPLTALAGAALTVYVLVATASVHPYQLDYYSELHGGAAGVARDKTFVLGWRGEGLDEALAYVARQAPRGASLCLEVRHPQRAVPRGDLKLVPRGQAADFLLRDASVRQAPPPGYRRAYTVRAAAAPLLTVYRR